MKQSIVILGAGHAGVQAAASLREEGFDGKVTLVSEERELPYHKPPLSKTFIKEPDAYPQPLRGEAFYEGHRIALELGRPVEKLDLQARRLVFANGATIAFDKLILATGSRPRALALPGIDLEGVVSLRTLADARIIRDLAETVEDVVVIGAGFIGLEIAATLAAGGRIVSVVEAMPRALGRAVAPPIAAHVQSRLAASGVRILTSAGVKRIEGEAGKASAVVLTSGERIAARMVVVGIGVVPNTELAQQAGLDVGNGVRVDALMRTSATGVAAIGDCANFRHWMTDADVRLESVQNATDQAKLAARSLLGATDAYDAVPWFWSDIGDMKLQMVGLIGSADQHVITGNPADNRFSVFHFAGTRLMAIETVNRPADHMLGRRILATEFTPDRAALAANPEGLKAAFAAWQAGADG